MKIIKHGTVAHFVCDVCGCEFIAGQEDVSNFYTEGARTSCDCPDCGSTAYAVNNAKSPKMVRADDEKPAEEKPAEEKTDEGRTAKNE